MIDLEQWQAVILWVVTVLGGGEAYRRLWLRLRSSDSVDEARNQVRISRAQGEKDYFDDAIDRLTKDRDGWKDACEMERVTLRERLDGVRAQMFEIHEQDAQIANDLRNQLNAVKAEIDALKAEARHVASNRALRLRLFRSHHPECDFALLESEPIPLDALASQTKP